MKTKISVDIHKSGSENDALLRMVANINEGIVDNPITVKNLMGYVEVRNAMYPSASKLFAVYNPPSLLISEDDGKTYTLTLTWKEVHELEPVEADDIKDINI